MDSRILAVPHDVPPRAPPLRPRITRAALLSAVGSRHYVGIPGNKFFFSASDNHFSPVFSSEIENLVSFIRISSI
ncbi:MAG: hypothetical protein ACI4QT_09680 [Kiritimatiellia bacterium]